MDPNECMQRIYHGFLKNDWEETKAACDDLLNWFSKRGFAPNPSKIQIHVLVSMAQCFCIQHIEMKRKVK